jgi:hypothetical protein
LQVLKEWFGLRHINSRNAFIHEADLEADLTLFKYAAHYKKRLILDVVEKAFQEGYSIDSWVFIEPLSCASPVVINAFNP